MRLLAVSSGSAWDALAAATCGGAAACGLEDLGTLATGKWADMSCLELGGPAMEPLNDPVTQLVFCGGRDMVSDVWVAGRQLLADREMTRLDWAAAAERAGAWARRLKS
jgi:5-methylthioadenosine/S-adenosylhomocysteine deaminase